MKKKNLTAHLLRLSLCTALISLISIFYSIVEAGQYSWRFEKAEPIRIGDRVDYDVEYSRIGGRNSSGEYYNEAEFKLIMKYFGVSNPQDLVGKVFTEEQPGVFLHELTKSVREEHKKAILKGWEDKYKKAGFSDSAPILNCDFSFSVVGGGFMGTFRDTVFEKAAWNGDQLEVSILSSLNCVVKGAKGTARLNGNRVELTIEPRYPSDGSMAQCESVFRIIFKIKGLEKKDYKLGFRIGLFTQEVFLNKENPIIGTNPLKGAM